MGSPDTRILILANSSLIRGLLRAYLDHAGYTPLEPEPFELPGQALERLRPPVVLLDCDVPGTCEPPFLDRARALGSRVVLFSPAHESQFVQTLASDRSLDWFGMPIDRESFLRTLAREGSGAG